MKSDLDKYIGKYRVVAVYDLGTNDFFRDYSIPTMPIISEDVYIECKRGKITKQKKNILKYTNEGIKSGFSIIRKINAEFKDKIFDIDSTDLEVEFCFNEKDLPELEKYLKIKTNGKSIPPYDNKNLPKSDYVIPKEDLKLLDEINTGRKLNKYTLNFIDNTMEDKIVKEFTKNNPKYKSLSKASMIEKDMADNKMKNNQLLEYIHFKGFWNDYIKYLKKLF